MENEIYLSDLTNLSRSNMVTGSTVTVDAGDGEKVYKVSYAIRGVHGETYAWVLTPVSGGKSIRIENE